MPLCGSSTCGCAISSVPATTGSINGHLPSIDVSGNGTTAYPWNLTLNDEWAVEVAMLGRKAIAKCSSSDQNGITTITDITGLSATWTAASNRVYKYTVEVNLQKGGSVADFITLAITDSSNIQIVGRSTYMTGTDFITATVIYTETGLSGSITRKVRVGCNTPTGSVNVANSFSRNGIFIVEDIGPA